MPPSNRRAAAGALIAAAIALTAAACSSGSSTSSTSSAGSTSSTGSTGASASASVGASALAGMSPDQIVQKSVANLTAASSVHISGRINTNGQAVTLDLTDVVAQGCQGTITVASTGSAATSGTADIIVADSTVYMKLDQEFFKNVGLPASLFSSITGKYIKVTSKSDLASFAQLCKPSSLSGAFAKEDTGFVKTGSLTINGQTTLAFRQPKNTAGGTVYVSDTATPEIVRIAGPAGQGAVNFTNYNAPVTVSPPPADQVIDGSTFGL